MHTGSLAEIRGALAENYSYYAEGLDSKNWGMVRDCFADNVYIDYGDISAPTGGPDVPRVTDDWLLILQSVINGFDITRHTITNHRVTVSGSRINCRAYLIADHIIFPDPAITLATDNDLMTVVGEYSNDYQLLGGQWKICRSALDIHYSRGNVEVMAQAMARAAGGTSGAQA